MKHSSSLYIAGALLIGACFTGCRDEHSLLGDGDGRMTLRTSILSDVKVVSRALSAEEQSELENSALIWVSDPKKGLLYTYSPLGSFPQDGLSLPTGTYAVEGWAGDSVTVSYDKRRYRGYQSFEIVAGQQTPVSLKCNIRNTIVSANFVNLEEVLSDCKLTVGLDYDSDYASFTEKHSATLPTDAEGNAHDKIYFMINSKSKGLKWTFTGVQKNGEIFKQEGVYTDPNLEPEPNLPKAQVNHATEYVFNVYWNKSEDQEMGGALGLKINVEREPITGTEETELILLPPTVKGLDGTDLTKGGAGAPGEFTDGYSFYAIASSQITKFMVKSNIFTTLGLQYEDYDLMSSTIQQSVKDQINGIGFVVNEIKHSEVVENATDDAITNLLVQVTPELLNKLPVGNYSIEMTIGSAEGETTTNFNIEISSAPVQPNEVLDSDVTYTSATITGTVVTGTANYYGFEVRKLAEGRAYEDWTRVDAVRNGNTLSANLTGLEAGKIYEFRVVADDFTSRILTFTTLAYPQLPNAGFENWQTSKSPYLLYGSGESMFWDSGNHGSSTMNKNVTVPDESIKHSGNYSIKLASQFVGIGTIGKFAAGNVFIGEYLKTDGTDGVLGWGREWPADAKPKKLKGWVKYSPVAISHVGSGSPAEYVKGEMDKGIIYIALLDGDPITYDGKQYPVVVKTKASERSLFSRNDALVLTTTGYCLPS